MERPNLADDLALKTAMQRGEMEMTATASGFTATGAPEGVRLTRFKEGLRLAKWNQSDRKIDIHYSQVGSVDFEGQSTNREQRSVVGRAAVGKYVAGETGALVGALSGLQDKITTSHEFSIRYWDHVRGEWKQHTLSSTDENFQHFMECVAEELDAYRRGEDPEGIPDPSGRSSMDRKLERGFNKFMGYAVGGVLIALLGWFAISLIVQGASSVFSRFSRSSGPLDVAVHQAQLAAEDKAKAAVPSPSPAIAASSVAPVADTATSAPPTTSTPGPSNQSAASVVETKVESTSPLTVVVPSTAKGQPAPQVQAKIQPQRVDPETGPSFDCAKASSTAENRVCANPALAALDRDLNQIYLAVRTPANQTALRMDQLAWLKSRAGCINDECLKTVYEKRIGRLRQYQQ